MPQQVRAEIAAVGGQFGVAQRFRPADEIAGRAAARPARSEPVLHRFHLHVIPIRPERAVNAAVMRRIAIPFRRSLPDAHRRQVRWLQRRDLPLIDGVIRNAVQAHFAAAPRLLSCPSDARGEVPRLTRRKRIDVARGAAATAAVHSHAHVAVRHPFFRVDHFPVLVQVARSGGHVGMLACHGFPRVGVAVLKGEAFGIGSVRQQHRIAAFAHGAKDVGAKDNAVVHGNRRVPIDFHSIANFRFHLRIALLGHRHSSVTQK